MLDIPAIQYLAYFEMSDFSETQCLLFGKTQHDAVQRLSDVIVTYSTT